MDLNIAFGLGSWPPNIRMILEFIYLFTKFQEYNVVAAAKNTVLFIYLNI